MKQELTCINMESLIKQFDNGSACMPGTVLSSLHPFSHCSQQSCEMSTISLSFNELRF